MTARQEAFARAQREAWQQDGDVMIYLAARQNGASAEHARWLLADLKRRAK